MGREFKPDPYASLLDFDNEVEGDTKSGLNLVDEWTMDQNVAQQQHTPSSGLHYIFKVDGEPIKQMGSKTCIRHNGIKYSMDVKFKNCSWNCQPIKIPLYGEFAGKSHLHW